MGKKLTSLGLSIPLALSLYSGIRSFSGLMDAKREMEADPNYKRVETLRDASRYLDGAISSLMENSGPVPLGDGYMAFGSTGPDPDLAKMNIEYALERIGDEGRLDDHIREIMNSLRKEPERKGYHGLKIGDCYNPFQEQVESLCNADVEISRLISDYYDEIPGQLTSRRNKEAYRLSGSVLGAILSGGLIGLVAGKRKRKQEAEG